MVLIGVVQVHLRLVPNLSAFWINSCVVQIFSCLTAFVFPLNLMVVLFLTSRQHTMYDLSICTLAKE